MKTWDELKKEGSKHYRDTDGIQPIDLYRDLGIFRSWAIAEICQHAIRNIGSGPDENPVSTKDMQKIIHYAELLIAACGEKETHENSIES
jgi:hypothetical protein